MSQRRVSLLLLALHSMMFLFALSAVLSLSVAYNPRLSIQPALVLVASVGLYGVVTYAARRRSAARLIAGAGVLLATGLALYFLTQFKYYAYPETGGVLRQIGEFTSVLPRLRLGYLNPDSVATVLEMLLPINLGLIFSSRMIWKRAFWLLCTAIMSLAVLLTVSWGAWIGLAISVGVWLVVLTLRWVSRKWGLSVAVSVAVTLGMLVLGVLVTLPHIGAFSTAIQTFGTRIELYRNSLYLIRDYAFTGIGLGSTFTLVYSRYSLLIFVPYLTYTHNLPLAVWFGQGLLGIAAFTAIVILFYIFVLRVIRHARGGGLFYGAWLGVTATLIHGLDDARQYTENPWVMPALFFGIGLTLACGIRALKRREDDTLPPRAPRITLVQAGIVLVILVGALVISYKPLLATWYTNRGALEETRADEFISPNMPDAQRSQLQAAAHDWYTQALAVDPGLPTANRRLGNLLVNQGDYAAAVPLLETALAQESSNPAAVKGLGLAYVWVGRTEEAAGTFRRLSDWESVANELQTWYQFRQNQNQTLLAGYALETYALLIGEAGTPPDVWLRIADSFRAAGDNTRAYKWYRLVLKYDETNPQAKAGLAALGE